MIAPVSMSMMSCMRCARFEFVESFTTGAIGLPVGVPSPVVNKTTLAPAPNLRRHAFDVVSRRALQIQSRLRRVFGIVEHRGHRRRAALLRRSRGFHRIGQQSVAHIAGRRIHFESRSRPPRPAPHSPHQLNESIADFFALAAIDQFLLHAAQLRKFRQDRPAAQAPRADRQYARSRDSPRCRRIRPSRRTSIPRTSRTAAQASLALLASTSPRNVCRIASDIIAASEPLCCCSRMSRGLSNLRIALANLFAKNRDLRVLAAQAQHRRSRHVGMMNVAGDQSAEIVGILPRSAAPAFVQQKADAVDVFEQAAALGRSRICAATA